MCLQSKVTGNSEQKTENSAQKTENSEQKTAAKDTRRFSFANFKFIAYG